jgi:hypothetical protein
MQLAEAVKQSARLNMHNTGKDLGAAIQLMDEFETESKKNIRQKYARSNKDLMRRLHAPIDKVFSAKGGSQMINLPESQLKEFNVFLATIRKGQSIYHWMQTTALDGYHIDPNGLIFLEIDKNGKPYPTYKSSSDIFYYELDGRKCNTVIFKLTNEQARNYGLDSGVTSQVLERMGSSRNQSRYYRVVDAVSDKVIEYDGKEVNEITGLTLSNYFMTVPAIVLSDIYEFDSTLFVSPDSYVIELLNSILCQNSIFEIWKNLHMFPKHWTIQSVCPTCEGAGTKSGEDCPDCNATGHKTRSSVRDEIVIAPPESTDGKITLPAAFDGYTTPPIEAWELATDDLDRMYITAYFTKWGTMPEMKANVKVSDKTATQVIQEHEGMISALYNYTKWYESTLTFIVDLCGGLLYPVTYKGASIKGGDRYNLESPDRILEKLTLARNSGSSNTICDGLLIDYFEAKYQGNPIMLEVALKQMQVEPFVHLTVLQVSQSPDITQLDKTCKTYFSEWKSTLTQMDWILRSDEQLRADMIKYCTPKVVAPAQIQAPDNESEK